MELTPVLVCIYERQTFGVDGGLRVTCDSQLTYFEPRKDLYDTIAAITPNVVKPIATGPAQILEVKCPDTCILPQWLKELVGPLRKADHFSKFQAGMEKLARGRAQTH